MTSKQVREFWPRAWDLDEMFAVTKPATYRLAAASLDDYGLQRFLFIHRGYNDPKLLPELIDAGLFNDPPAPEERIFWPLLAYVDAVVEFEPDLVGAALSSIRTQSSFVLEHALKCAVRLPGQAAVPVVELLADQWLRSDANYFESRLWQSVLEVRARDERRDLGEWLGLLLFRGSTLGGSDYELKEMLDSLSAMDWSQRRRSQVLEAIQSALAIVLGLSGSYVSSLRLADLRADFPSDADAELARGWLRMASRTDPSAIRAGVLLSAKAPLLVQLGLRELARVPHENFSSTTVLALLRPMLLADASYGYDRRDEFLPLLASRFPSLESSEQAAVITRAISASEEPEGASRIQARDTLSALSEYLGPRERVALQELEGDLGPYEPERPSVTFSRWSSDGGPIEADVINRMSPRELLPYLRHPGAVGTSTRGSSDYDLARQIAPLVAADPVGYLQVISGEKSSIASPAVHAVIAEALLKEVANGRRDLDVGAVCSYATWTLRRFDAPQAHDRSARLTVLWGALKVSESLSERPGADDDGVDRERAAEAVLPALRLGMRDEHPASSEDGDFDGDLLSSALNTNRPVAARAMFNVLRYASAEEDNALQTRVARVLAGVARQESHPAVLSVYGQNLYLILRGRPNALSKAVLERLGSESGQVTDWVAIFGSYVATHNPSLLDERLVEEYRRAQEVRELPAAAHLRRYWESVLIHEIAGFLYRDPGTWWPLLENAMDSAELDQRRGALRALGHSFESDTEFDFDRVMDLASSRAASAERLGDTAEASAVASMLVQSQLSIARTGAVLTRLMTMGAQVKGRDLLPLLSRDAEVAPLMAGRLLSAYARTESQSWVWESIGEDLTNVLVALNGLEAGRQDAVEVVELLGQEGHFLVEPAARIILGRAV